MLDIGDPLVQKVYHLVTIDGKGPGDWVLGDTVYLVRVATRHPLKKVTTKKFFITTTEYESDEITQVEVISLEITTGHEGAVMPMAAHYIPISKCYYSKDRAIKEAKALAEDKNIPLDLERLNKLCR